MAATESVCFWMLVAQGRDLGLDVGFSRRSSRMTAVLVSRHLSFILRTGTI